MAIRFRTLLSSSSGNCILLQTHDTNLLIDCGFKSQKACRAALAEAVGDLANIDGVVVTHNHGDHISYSSLKVLEKEGVPVYAYRKSAHQMALRHFKGYGFRQLIVNFFENAPFSVGDFTVEPVALPHHPGMDSFGFVIRYSKDGRDYKILTAADFSDGEALTDHLLDADLIYIESNHDLELLKMNFNYNSYYHMNNPATAKLLAEILPKRKTPPKAVVLGHLSAQRNKPHIAIKEVQKAFYAVDTKIDFPLTAAPHYEASEELRLL